MHKELVKSKAPRRWMGVFVVLLVIAAAALAWYWLRMPGSAARSASVMESAPQQLVLAAFEPAPAWNPARELRCEMVRVWPLPSECLLVFPTGASGN